MGDCADMILDGILDANGEWNGDPEYDVDRDTHRIHEQARRTEFALSQLKKVNIEPYFNDGKELRFLFKNEEVKFFPYSGWASGKSINDGRGIANLIKQLK
jgi:hypothetical protein